LLISFLFFQKNWGRGEYWIVNGNNWDFNCR